MVPQAFLRYMPREARERIDDGHNTVNLCRRCHDVYECNFAIERNRELASQIKVPIDGIESKKYKKIHKLSTYAKILLFMRHTVSESKLEEIEAYIANHLKKRKVTEKDLDLLYRARFNPKLKRKTKTFHEAFVKKIKNFDKFEQEWRDHFFDNMKPKPQLLKDGRDDW